MSVERELGEISATLRSLHEGQGALREDVVKAREQMHERQTAHEVQDEGRHIALWGAISGIQRRLAYYAGALALACLLAELFLRR